ncbi:MAG: GGDEF domain-containing protein [Gammaproteobacteria bacterium]|nr:GGDEF domain-containing protein [Gammaproteobacteria bacterium]
MQEELTQIIKAQLAEAPLFRGVDLSELEPTLAACKVQVLERNDVLLRQGEPNTALYVVVSGELRVDLEHQESIATLAAGDCVGELSLIEGKPATASVMATSRAVVLAVDEAQLWGLVETSYRIARNLLLILAGRMRRDHQLLTEGMRQQEYYRRHALIDALTGVYNRRWLEEHLPEIIKRAADGEESLALLMVDVDWFKRYNDRHGHTAGDRALQAVTGALQAQLRPSDVVARYGGEEFVIVLPSVTRQAALAVADRLRVGVRNTKVLSEDGGALPGVTVSVGVAHVESDQTPPQLIAAADAALYRAKKAGRDSVWPQTAP